MSEPGKPPVPLATGGMSPEGTTTVVKIYRPQLDPADKKVICSAICKCKENPGVGKDGRSLKQICVSSRLKQLDALMDHRSSYKPEVTYDMTKRPPAPFMEKEPDTKMRDLFPGWTQRLWPKDPSRPVPYMPGRGYTRRPDVVVVKDPLKPPTQDNIKQVVEIKFPGDPYGPGQRQAYITIAGDDTKMVSVGPENCDCDKPEPEQPKVPVEQLAKAAAVTGVLYMLVTKRPPPMGVPAF